MIRPTILALVTLLTCTVGAQVQLPRGMKLPSAVPLPSLADLTRGEPPLATSVATIPLHGWPQFDDMHLTGFRDLANADRASDGRFRLTPGRYRLDLESFCARGYTFGPTEGDGYVLGAWRGSKADLLREVMRRYTVTDGVSQQDTQLLVWAILARVHPKDMQGGARRAMVQLFGDRGPELLARGALEYFSEDATRKLFARAGPLRPVLEYENRMRGMFREAGRTYAEFERLAILPAPAGPPSVIPAARWNIHPAGYLVRFSSTGYTRATMEVVVPGRPVVTRDGWRRVTRFAIDDYALAISYEADDAGVPYPADRALAAHPVSRVRMEVPEARGGVLERSVSAWVFKGTPSTRRRAAAESGSHRAVARRAGAPRALWGAGAPSGASRPAALSLGPGSWSAGGGVQFDEWHERYERVSETRERLETYEEWYARQERIRRGERPDEDVFDASHLRDLVRSIFGSRDDRLEQIGETHGRLAEWLAHATRLLDTLPDGAAVDPTDQPYAPGRSGGQTLISSGRVR